jgi:hypothetical protein
VNFESFKVWSESDICFKATKILNLLFKRVVVFDARNFTFREIGARLLDFFKVYQFFGQFLTVNLITRAHHLQDIELDLFLLEIKIPHCFLVDIW